MHRWTTLDGQPCDPHDHGLRLDALAATFAESRVDLAKVERAVIGRLNPRVRRAVRAHARLHSFQQQLAIWSKAAPQLRALRRAGAPSEQLAVLNRLRPLYFAPDARGRYAWARRELLAELRAAWPRVRRTDTLQTAVIRTVRAAILKQLYPEAVPHRPIDRGINAMADQLAEQFLAIHYPFLANGATADRIRRRPSLPRARSN